MDELQRLIENEVSAKCAIFPYLAAVVSDLAAVTEFLHQMEIYYPWAHAHTDLMRLRLDALGKSYAKDWRSWTEMSLGLQHSEGLLGNLGAPTDGKFAYPVGKRRTQANFEAMRTAEKNLDNFWHQADELMKSTVSNLANNAAHRMLMQERSLQRTPAWSQPEKMNVQPAVEELYIPFSQLFLDSQKRVDRDAQGDSNHHALARVKTRGVADAEDNEIEPVIVAQPKSVKSEPHFAVNDRALKVFRAIFFAPSINATPGEVPWIDFLHAMVSVGFTVEKLRGSEWRFDTDSDRSIKIDDPHPKVKIPYFRARRIGRKLNRAYVMHGGMFSLAPKVEQ